MTSEANIRVDSASNVPIYRQIVEGLRALLVSEKLQPGMQLPTVRDLALDLGVHFNTVAEAYRLLADEGWLELKRRRGAVVIRRTAPQATRKTADAFGRRLREMIAQVRSEGLSVSQVTKELQGVAEELNA